MSFQQLVE